MTDQDTVVSKIERCVGNPSLDMLLKLANRLDTTVSALLAPKGCFFRDCRFFPQTR